MSKGLTYETVDDLPERVRRQWSRRAADRSVSLEEYSAPMIAEHNAQWAIVGKCPQCGKDLIAGEYRRHYANSHVRAGARRLLRELLEAPPDDAKVAVTAFADIAKAEKS